MCQDAATVLGYVQAKLLLAAGAEHEAHARRLLADFTQGVLAVVGGGQGNSLPCNFIEPAGGTGGLRLSLNRY